MELDSVRSWHIALVARAARTARLAHYLFPLRPWRGHKILRR